jgi:hypothetical protein
MALVGLSWHLVVVLVDLLDGLLDALTSEKTFSQGPHTHKHTQYLVVVLVDLLGGLLDALAGAAALAQTRASQPLDEKNV